MLEEDSSRGRADVSSDELAARDRVRTRWIKQGIWDERWDLVGQVFSTHCPAWTPPIPARTTSPTCAVPARQRSRLDELESIRSGTPSVTASVFDREYDRIFGRGDGLPTTDRKVNRSTVLALGNEMDFSEIAAGPEAEDEDEVTITPRSPGRPLIEKIEAGWA
ncbi:hypothetical protein BDW68DRAFT_176621 [Aspergillus falconensis]